MKVEELEQIVRAHRHENPKQFTGVSDHLMHAQNVTIESGTFSLATFNVLAEKYKWHINGVQDWRGAPDQFNLKDMQGLESQPLAKSQHEFSRKSAIIRMVVRFFENSKTHTILCLQECDRLLRNLLQKILKDRPSIRFIEHNESNKTVFNLTLFRGFSSIEQIHPGEIMRVQVDGETRFNLVNFHGPFKTVDTLNELSNILDRTWRLFPIFIVGNYNVQVMPLSERAKNEGSTITLIELVNSFFAQRQLKCEFAAHRAGWTNWNSRKNCIDPEMNTDHFDNIMMAHCGDKTVAFSPIKYKPEKLWWEMK